MRSFASPVACGVKKMQGWQVVLIGVSANFKMFCGHPIVPSDDNTSATRIEYLFEIE
jgi:hypothetical protein